MASSSVSAINDTLDELSLPDILSDDESFQLNQAVLKEIQKRERAKDLQLYFRYAEGLEPLRDEKDKPYRFCTIGTPPCGYRSAITTNCRKHL